MLLQGSGQKFARKSRQKNRSGLGLIRFVVPEFGLSAFSAYLCVLCVSAVSNAEDAENAEDTTVCNDN